MNWESILIAIIGSGILSTIIVSTKDLWLFYLQNKFRTKSELTRDLLASRVTVYDILNRLKRKVQSPRILILYTENGGGLPTPGSQIYISILYEAVDIDTKSIKMDVQRLTTDEEYDKLISSLANGEFNKIITDDIEDGILKKFYKLDNIKESFIVPITQKNNRFYYMSVAWHEEILEQLQDNHEIEILAEANNIKALLDKT
jgi:hypothetical protein